MLQAVLHGKAGRVEQEGKGSISWRELFKTREDLLTAAVFSRFAYFSQSLQQHLMIRWLNSDLELGELKKIEFWPRYMLKRENENRSVEPDLLIRFTDANVLIEVKPPQGGGQDIEQWSREVESFLQSDDSEGLPLHFCAIGQLGKAKNNDWEAELYKRHAPALSSVSTLEWMALLKTLQNCEGIVFSTPQDLRVKNDILDALHLYGLNTSTFDWVDLKKKPFPALSLNRYGLRSSRWFKNSIAILRPEPRLTVIKNGTNLPRLSLECMRSWNR